VKIAGLGTPHILRLRYMLCPFTIAWCKFERGASFEEWKALYIFGIRVAIWRCD